MKVWTFSIIYNEARVLPFFLRHYRTFCDRMFFWVDPFTDDGTRELLAAEPKAIVTEWPHKTGLDDEEFKATFNYWPRKLAAEHGIDWAIACDADELLWNPNPDKAFTTYETDAMKSRGYALIDPKGFKKDNGKQVYEQVKTGLRQDNYDKHIIFRPSFPIDFSHGRHEVHSYGGRLAPEATWKLYHLHHLWGVQHTKERNARNIERAKEKRFAWAYTPKQEALATGGTAKWVEDAIKNKALIDVVKEQI